MIEPIKDRPYALLGKMIFFSRWLQAPLYLGLIIAQEVYVILWQVIVHMTFVVSALLLAWTDRISTITATDSRAKH